MLCSELHALARKYRALAELRRGVLAPEPTVLRALAREFPGALRELECLPLDMLDRRLDSVIDGARGEPTEEWIDWILAYHRRMRIVLAIKRRLADISLQGEQPSPIDSSAVALHVWSELRERCDPALVLAVARPPGGRLNRLVFALLERELERPRAEIEAVLFPELGPSRSQRRIAEGR